MHTKVARILAGWIRRQAFCKRADGPRQVVGNHRGGAQSLHRIPTFGDRTSGLLDDLLQCLLDLWSVRNLVRYSRKLQQHPLKTLQQSIVKVAGNPLPLSNTRFDLSSYSLRDLTYTQLIESNEQSQESGEARHVEPGGLVVGWRDAEIQECAGLVPHTAVVTSR